MKKKIIKCRFQGKWVTYSKRYCERLPLLNDVKLRFKNSSCCDMRGKYFSEDKNTHSLGWPRWKAWDYTFLPSEHMSVAAGTGRLCGAVHPRGAETLASLLLLVVPPCSWLGPLLQENHAVLYG